MCEYFDRADMDRPTAKAPLMFSRPRLRSFPVELRRLSGVSKEGVYRL